MMSAEGEPLTAADEADIADARETLARIAGGEATIPWEQVKTELAEDDPEIGNGDSDEE